MSKQNLAHERLVRTAYEAFAKGDLDTLRTLNAEDSVWHTPGISPFNTEYKSVDGVMAYFTQLFELTEGTIKVEPEHMYGDDERVVVLEHVTASAARQTHRLPRRTRVRDPRWEVARDHAVRAGREGPGNLLGVGQLTGESRSRGPVLRVRHRGCQRRRRPGTRHGSVRRREWKRRHVAVIVARGLLSCSNVASTTIVSWSMLTGEAVSRTVGPSGVGRRNRTSKPAVMKGTGAPGAACQSCCAASHITTAAPWQSSTVEMIPPLRKPKPLSCSGRGVNSATVRSRSR